MCGAPGRFAGALPCAFAQFALLLYCAYTRIGQNIVNCTVKVKQPIYTIFIDEHVSLNTALRTPTCEKSLVPSSQTPAQVRSNVLLSAQITL